MRDRVTVEEIATLPSIEVPAASPSGQSVAAYCDDTGRNELYIFNSINGSRVKLSDGNVPENNEHPITWLPDGDAILFHDDFGESNRNGISLMDLDGSVEKLISHTGQCLLVDVSSNGNRLLYRCNEDGPHDLYEFSFADRECQQLTSTPGRISDAYYGPDRDRVVYKSNEHENPQNRDIWILDRTKSEQKKLDIGRPGSHTDVEDWNAKRNIILVEDNMTGTSRCGIYDVEAETTSWLTPEDTIESGLTFLPDGNRVLATRVDRCKVTPVCHYLNSNNSYIFDLPDGFAKVPSYRNNGILSDSCVLVVQQTPTERRTILEYDLKRRESRVMIEPDYGSLSPNVFVDCSYKRVESFDGTELEALIYDSGRHPSPLIVQIHGGPVAQDFRTFDALTQSLVTSGYSVLKVNYRGSRGRGREFRKLLLQNFGDEQRDIATAVRNFARQSWIDEDRIAPIGDSFGGYCVLMQLSLYPNLYAAGVAMSAPTNLLDLFENSRSLEKNIINQLLGDVTQNQSQYEDASPITYADQIETPLCLIHGAADQRVPVSQARQFVEEFESTGSEQEAKDKLTYHELDGLGHSMGSGDTRSRVYNLYTEFLDQHLIN